MKYFHGHYIQGTYVLKLKNKIHIYRNAINYNRNPFADGFDQNYFKCVVSPGYLGANVRYLFCISILRFFRTFSLNFKTQLILKALFEVFYSMDFWREATTFSRYYCGHRENRDGTRGSMFISVGGISMYRGKVVGDQCYYQSVSPSGGWRINEP